MDLLVITADDVQSATCNVRTNIKLVPDFRMLVF